MTMHEDDVTSEPRAEPARRGPRWWWIIGSAVGVVVLVAVGLALAVGIRLFHAFESRSVPSFPSLATKPDPALHGTVAYFANDTGCVRIVAAAGAPSKDVLCIPAQDLAVRPELGVKPAGPQLVWLPGDRLEVTMFWWKPAPGPLVYQPGWQKIVDVRSGAVQDVPATQAPSAPNYLTEPTINAHGDRVAYTLDGMSGRVKVTLADNSGATRTLLSAQGPGEYTYRFGPVFWAPNGQWVAASDDGRILVITPGPPAATRVLVTRSGGGAGGGTAGPSFAITASDLLGTGK